jgi:hypothetical protein
MPAAAPAPRPFASRFRRQKSPRGAESFCRASTSASGQHAGICEGLEDALDVRQRGWRPIWCCGSAVAVASFPVLAGVEALTIFADNDDAGLAAAQRSAARWRAAGREVAIIPPRAAKDWNGVAA